MDSRELVIIAKELLKVQHSGNVEGTISVEAQATNTLFEMLDMLPEDSDAFQACLSELQLRGYTTARELAM